ncbi:MAG: prepilin-type N-terminal cleavage/methylation domain-containing protein [Phycisphaerae bacterium]|jgi:prepilin-type processing-associated H-X9-DG protein/prepilin-type N-terminal cleavage/methylation domain-containing protein
MRKQKAFTLVELLVVISVIALLLAILMPSLAKARELAYRIVCGQHLKTFGQASNSYASTYDGFYVPLSFKEFGEDPFKKDPPDFYDYRWLHNDAFIAYIQKKELTGADNEKAQKGVYALPKEFLCPSDPVSKDPQNVSKEGVLLSYAYNASDWPNEAIWFKYKPDVPLYKGFCGHKIDMLKSPADKLQFTDGIDWWCKWYKGADYRIGWDKLGHSSIDDYKADPYNIDGPVLYRHNEGANVGFYDGHVEYLKKQEIFIKEDYDSGTTPKWCGMWTASGWWQ